MERSRDIRRMEDRIAGVTGTSSSPYDLLADHSAAALRVRLAGSPAPTESGSVQPDAPQVVPEQRDPSPLPVRTPGGRAKGD